MPASNDSVARLINGIDKFIEGDTEEASVGSKGCFTIPCFSRLSYGYSFWKGWVVVSNQLFFICIPTGNDSHFDESLTKIFFKWVETNHQGKGWEVMLILRHVRRCKFPCMSSRDH